MSQHARCLLLFSASLLAACANSNVTGIGDAPTALMGTATYSNSLPAIANGNNATLHLSFSGADNTIISNGSATTSAGPTGVIISTTGTAACGLVTVSSASKTGATFTFSGCTGDGSVSINAVAGAAITGTNQLSDESNTESFLVANTAPTISLSNFTVSQPAHGATSATFTLLFDEEVQAFSSTGSPEFTVSSPDCATAPTILAPVGQINSSTQSQVIVGVDQSGCAVGDQVSLHLNLNDVYNIAHVSGVANAGLTQVYTVQ